jgi:hypothetical protein
MRREVMKVRKIKFYVVTAVFTVSRHAESASTAYLRRMNGHNVTVNVNVIKQVNRILEIFFRVRLGIYRDLYTADSAYTV